MVYLTQNKRWTSTSVSLTAGESESADTEISGADVFQTPENQHILNRISSEIENAFNSNGFRIPNGKKHQKAFILIRKAIQTGEFFHDRTDVMKKLRRIGLKNSEVEHYIDYTLIKVRQKLLGARGDLDVLTFTSPERSISKIVSR